MTDKFGKASKKKFTHRVLRKSLEPFFIGKKLLKSKIDILNLNFRPFFCSKRQSNLKKHLKMNFYVAFEENRLYSFFETRTFES